MSTEIENLPKYVQEKIPNANVPVKYDVAVRALTACRNIDEAKHYADKSDALAAWARIYKDEHVKVEAKRLKLHAYRRMGVLAREIRPGTERTGRKGGSIPGPVSLLKEMGLSRNEAQSASLIGAVSNKRFKNAIDLPSPPAPSTFKFKNRKGVSEAWKSLTGASGRGYPMTGFRGFCRNNDPKKIARALSWSEVEKVREMATEIIEWMDAFDQYLPKKAHNED